MNGHHIESVNFATLKQKRLRLHTKTHKQNKNFKCIKCDDEFDDQEKLTKHIQINVEIIYKSDVCHKQVESKEIHKKNSH